MKTTINRRILTVALSVAMLLQLLSIGISAETISTEEAILQPLQEVVSLREPSSKQFEMADGQYVALMYSDPVHFQNADGDWVEIDNSLKSVAFTPTVFTAAAQPALPTVGYYENTTNDFKVQIPARFASYAPFKVTYGGHTLQFVMQDAAQASVVLPADEKAAVAAEKTALVEAARTAAQNGNAEQSKKLLTEAAGRLANQTATVAYKNILPGVSTTYRVGSRSFKETLIFSQIPEQSSFSFNFTYTGLTPVLQKDNSVYFYAADEEEPVFVIASPYMADAADGFSRDITVTVTPTASGCTYTLTPDAAWLADPARVYPVELDPTVTTEQDAMETEDAGVNQSNPTTNYFGYNRMYVGSNLSGSTAQESRVFIRFDLPSNLQYTYIDEATLTMWHYHTASYQSSSNLLVDVFSAGNFVWDSADLRWVDQESAAFGGRISRTQITDKADMDLSTDILSKRSYDDFNITSIVKAWIYGTAVNNGLVLKPSSLDSTKTNRVCYVSSDVGSASATLRPIISINYHEGVIAPELKTYTTYCIRNVYSGKFVEIPNLESTGRTAELQKYNNKDNQKWYLIHVDKDVYRIVSEYSSSFRLGVTGTSPTVGQGVNVASSSGRGYLFHITRNNDKTYKLESLCGEGYVLDAGATTPTADGDLVLWADEDSSYQKWVFEEVFVEGQDYILNPVENTTDDHPAPYYSTSFSASVVRGNVLQHNAAQDALLAWGGEVGDGNLPRYKLKQQNNIW